jgi:hypothetical protein
MAKLWRKVCGDTSMLSRMQPHAASSTARVSQLRTVRSETLQTGKVRRSLETRPSQTPPSCSQTAGASRRRRPDPTAAPRGWRSCPCAGARRCLAVRITTCGIASFRRKSRRRSTSTSLMRPPVFHSVLTSTCCV